MRLVLTLWAALALWLVPATGASRVERSGVRAVATHDASSLEAARTPERADVSPRSTAPAFPRATGGTPSVLAVAGCDAWWHVATQACGRTRPQTARRVVAPRRLAFPVEANAPPVALS